MLRLAADENFNADIVRGLLRRLPDLDTFRMLVCPALTTLRSSNGRQVKAGSC
jgi:hypothetical protein